MQADSFLKLMVLVQIVIGILAIPPISKVAGSDHREHPQLGVKLFEVLHPSTLESRANPQKHSFLSAAESSSELPSSPC